MVILSNRQTSQEYTTIRTEREKQTGANIRDRITEIGRVQMCPHIVGSGISLELFPCGCKCSCVCVCVCLYRCVCCMHTFYIYSSFLISSFPCMCQLKLYNELYERKPPQRHCDCVLFALGIEILWNFEFWRNEEPNGVYFSFSFVFLAANERQTKTKAKHPSGMIGINFFQNKYKQMKSVVWI